MNYYAQWDDLDETDTNLYHEDDDANLEHEDDDEECSQENSCCASGCMTCYGMDMSDFC
jgi:hypothetical protein